MLQSKKLIQQVHRLQFECKEQGRIDGEHENKEKPQRLHTHLKVAAGVKELSSVRTGVIN